MPHPNQLAGIVMELTVVRANLVNELKDVNAALAGLGKLGTVRVPPSRGAGGQPCLESDLGSPEEHDGRKLKTERRL